MLVKIEKMLTKFLGLMVIVHFRMKNIFFFIKCWTQYADLFQGHFQQERDCHPGVHGLHQTLQVHCLQQDHDSAVNHPNEGDF